MAIQKRFVKKQFRVIWALGKSQFSGYKMLRSCLIAASLTALSFYFCMFARNSPGNFNFPNGFLFGSAISPIVMVPVFLLQRYVRWHLFGVVKSQMVFRVIISFFLMLISISLFNTISGSELSLFMKSCAYSVVWTFFSLSFISILEYSKTYEADYWYRTR